MGTQYISHAADTLHTQRSSSRLYMISRYRQLLLIYHPKDTKFFYFTNSRTRKYLFSVKAPVILPHWSELSLMEKSKAEGISRED